MIKIRTIEPRKELSEYIRKISLFKTKGKIIYKQKLTPSAFTYLSYNSKDIPTSKFGKKSVQPKSRLQIAGPKISEENYVVYNGELSQILIEFSASGFYYLFNTSPSNLNNNLTDLNNFLDNENYKQLEFELLQSQNMSSQIEILEEFLIDKISTALPFIDYIEKALMIIEKHKGHINITNVVDKLSIGIRQFDRKFLEVVGITPKSYSKIVQLHYVIKLMQSKRYNSLQDLSYQAEFYDHSHFANQFKELTGFTPNEFIKSNRHIALKYFTDLPK